MIVVSMLMVATFGVALPTPASAAADYRGTIVDAETGQPLEGVVVLAVWYRRYNSPGGAAGGGYYASEETTTGPDGQFVIKGHSTWTLLPFITKIEGPNFTIYKPGYGQWRFQGLATLPADAYERRERVDEAWEKFRSSGVIIELPRLRSMEERLRFIPNRDPELPDSQAPRLLEAINRERLTLGLPPLSPRSE